MISTRADTLARGIIINGLAIMIRPSVSFGPLDRYYRDCVIGGPGAFMIPVRDRSQFAEAIKAKIIQEIAGERRPEPLVSTIQVETRANCLAGELRTRQRMGN